MVALTITTNVGSLRITDGHGQQKILGGGARHFETLKDGEEIRVEGIPTPKPVVDADTFRDKLIGVIRGAWEEVQAGGEDLSDEAMILWHDAMHAVGAGPPRSKPDVKAGPPTKPDVKS
jgi:hypothetical protein